MTTVVNIHDWLEAQAGHALHGDEGISFGDMNQPVTKAAVCWMPSPVNIRRAAAAGAELLIHHEALLYPYPSDLKTPNSALHWPTNRNRLTALVETRLVATRLHGTLDELYIYDSFAEQVGLTNAAVKGDNYAHVVFEIDPLPYADLIERVKQATGMPAVRATCVKPDRIVRRVGLPWGGLGLFVNVNYQQQLLELCSRIDVMIAGETDNYGFRFATELGIDMIETSHEVSEDRGLQEFAEALGAGFDSLETFYVDDPCVWQVR